MPQFKLLFISSIPVNFLCLTQPATATSQLLHDLLLWYGKGRGLLLLLSGDWFNPRELVLEQEDGPSSGTLAGEYWLLSEVLAPRVGSRPQSNQ